MNNKILPRIEPEITVTFDHPSAIRKDHLGIDILPMTPAENAIRVIPIAGDGYSRPVDVNRLQPGKSRSTPLGPYSQVELKAISQRLFLPSSGLKRELAEGIRKTVAG